jgi:hypothetical protein
VELELGRVFLGGGETYDAGLMRKLITLTLLTLLGIATSAGIADARPLRAPALTSPANGARVQQLPAISWNAVRGAVEYEYQVAADPRFNSLALGKGIGKGTAQTYNLAAALDKAVANGTYYWRVRGLTAKNQVGRWSAVRKIVKQWNAAPQITGGNGVTVSWPAQALVLRWSSVPYANKYVVSIATDPGLSNLVVGTRTKPVETQGVNFALPTSLAPGAYYWAITPVDAEGHRGARSALGTFQWAWPSSTTATVADLNPEAGIFDNPIFSWNPVPGAARYEVEVNSAQNFAPGSKWCCAGTTLGTSLAPMAALANNRYYWRVRALDAHGNAGVWNEGRPFEKAFDPTTPTVRGLTVRNAEGKELGGVPSTDTPIVTWDPTPGASLYEVQLGIHEALGCDFSKSATNTALHAATATPAWTPLARNGAGHQGPAAWPTPQQQVQTLEPGKSYCVRVLARTDDDAQHNQVVSAWTQINGTNQAAFQYVDTSSETEAKNAQEEKEEGEGKRPQCPATRGPIVKSGLWSGGATYAKNDVVEDKNGSFYLSLTSGNIGHEPSLSPEYWSLLELATPGCAYRLPATGTTTALTPLLTWKRVALAEGYFVVIARDPRFTEVADVGYTNVPAYAPRLANEAPLSDETTGYYWAVIPTSAGDGHGVFSTPCFATPTNHCEGANDNPQRFDKSSVPPQPLSPSAGSEVSAQPSFRWSLVDNARTYQLQVASDPSFAKPIDDVTTDATAYTSNSTYPADTALYWRVRATDWRGQGLNWSPTESFVRRLPVPALDPLGPTTLLGIPPITWSSVQGAIGYEMRVEQPNGKIEDFNLESPSASVVTYYGTGIVHYQVRASFPTSSSAKVSGAYSAKQSSLLMLAAPRGVRGIKTGSRLLVTWHPEPDAKQYEVQVSTTNGFNSRLEAHRVDGTSWAPNINPRRKRNRGTLYWRVAPVDQRGGVGSFTSGQFKGAHARRPACPRHKGHKPHACKKH